MEEIQYKDFLERLDTLFFKLDLQRRWVYVNEACKDIFGYSKEEMLGRDFNDYLPEDERSKCTQLLEGVIKNGIKIRRGEARIRAKGNEEKMLGFSLYPDKSKDGTTVGILGIGRDITKFKKVEEAVKKSEEYFRAVIENSLDIIIIVDKKGIVRYISPSIESFVGYKQAEIIGKSAFDFIHPADLPRAAVDFAKALMTKETNIPNSFRVRHKDGSDRIFEGLGSNLLDNPAVAGFVMNVRDVTEHNRTEKESAKMLLWQQSVGLLQQSLLAPAPLVDKLKIVTDKIVLLFGADFCRIWLIRPGDMCGRGCIHAGVNEGPHICRYRDKCLHLLASSGRYTHTDGKVHARVPFGCYKIGRIASGEDHKFLTNEAQTDPRVHNHEWAHELGLVSFAGYQLRVPGGEILGVLALFAKHPILSAEDAMLDGLSNTVSFVVQQTIAEETLRISEIKNRVLLDNLPQKVFYKDKNMVYISCNKNYALDLNIKPEEIAGKTDHDFFPKDLAEKYRSDDKRIMETGKMEDIEEKYLAEGQEFFVHTVKTSVKNEKGESVGILGIFWDITERKKMEEERKDRVIELEQYKELTVDRELKMIELKKEINKITEELGKPAPDDV